MTDLRAAVERLLWTTMDHDGERFTLPADSDGRFAPAENLRELATLLSQPEPSSQKCPACGRPRSQGHHDPIFGSCEEPSSPSAGVSEK
jgi:hypothetical protein